MKQPIKYAVEFCVNIMVVPHITGCLIYSPEVRAEQKEEHFRQVTKVLLTNERRKKSWGGEWVLRRVVRFEHG